MRSAFELATGFVGKTAPESTGSIGVLGAVDALPAHSNAPNGLVTAFPDSNEGHLNTGLALGASPGPGGCAKPDRFGPWAAELTPAERTARLRSLRSLARLLAPSETQRLITLRMAETDPAALDDAYQRLLAVPALIQRRILSTFAELHRPTCTSTALNFADEG
jgi:hypothetical protein